MLRLAETLDEPGPLGKRGPSDGSGSRARIAIANWTKWSCSVRAKATSSDNSVASRDGFDGAGSLVREFSHEATSGVEHEATPASSAAIRHASALWIYLKHRGVLNVEEFRRTRVHGS